MIGVASHPWMRGLFGDADMERLFTPEAELARFLQVEAAWTRALGEAEAVAEAEQVARGIEAAPITPGDLADGMAKDGVPIPELVRRLKQHVGSGHEALVHKGLTSQDVQDTSLAQTLVNVMGLLEARLTQLDEAFSGLEDRFGDRTLPAFTRMQPALETSVKDIVGCWRQPIPRLLSDAVVLKERLGIIQWGGPIGLRDHPKAEALGAAFARHLGLADPGAAWHTDRTPVLEVAQFLARVTVMTGKLGEDVALYAVAGPDHISFAGGGSSAMPHKNNPVKAEALIALADHANTLVASITRAARHEGHRSGQAWMLEWLTLPQFCLTAGASTLLAIAVTADIEEFG